MKVFISHSSKDKKFVRTLKDCLNENNIETWFDDDQLDFGDSLITKLEIALNDSSHLVIILSPFSIESDWVKLELDKALKNNRTGLTNKIIPIKYRECKIPESLSDLLYADLSSEVVLPTGDRVKFISDGFDNFFLRLVRALKNSAKTINTGEKEEILKAMKSTEKVIAEHNKLLYRGNLKLLGFFNIESRLKYQNIIGSNLKNKSKVEDYRPILLPAAAKHLFKLKIGDKILLEDELFFESYGHFAGYRGDDIAIVLDKRIRDELQISRLFYQVEMDAEKRLIKFAGVINTVS